MATPIPTPLKYSDYLAGAAIVTGTIGTSSFIQGLVTNYPSAYLIVGAAGLVTTVFVSLSQWLQSKGD